MEKIIILKKIVTVIFTRKIVLKIQNIYSASNELQMVGKP